MMNNEDAMTKVGGDDLMSDLLKTYAKAIESRSADLETLTADDKIVAALSVLTEIVSLTRRYSVELRRVTKARRAAMPGFLRDAED